MRENELHMTGDAVTGAGTRRRHVLTAVAGALVAMAMQASPWLRDGDLFGDDNDSMLRLVEVRDLLAGQGWYDLVQHRMGPAGGFEMHWSRLVDAPIAALILLGQALGLPPGTAETAAAFLFPLLLALPALYAIIRIAVALGGGAATFPAAAIGTLALFFSGLFAPGMLDHHAPQAMLVLWLILLLGAAPLGAGTGAGAGAVAALMAGIGAETHPHVAAGALAAALIWLVGGDARARAFAAAFGLVFAAGIAAIFVGTVPPAHFDRVVCDALSFGQAAPAVAGGLGLAFAALLTLAGATPARRFAVLAAAALPALLAAALWARPCLGDPLAGLDPLVRQWWLDHVEEARPLLQVLRANPAIGLGYAMTPLIALAVLGHGLWSGRPPRRAQAVILGALALGLAIAAVQVRGALITSLVAVAPLAAMVGRIRAHGGTTAKAQLLLLAGWLVSVNLVWALAGLSLDRIARPRPAPAPAAELPPSCLTSEALAALANEPPTTVFAISNLGSAILLHTPHHALAGPYHRNDASNRAVIEALIAPPEEGAAKVRATGATLIAWCAGNPESRFFARRAPGSLAAALQDGRPPAAFEPFGATTGPVVLFRLAPP